MTAYYNEIDPFAAAWLRNLISSGHIAPGIVDERDIRDVNPTELDRFHQCHFFAGIGGWSLALRLAGWPDDKPVWTGSCPCQSFSSAGQGKGFDDERHLWPVWFNLIRECRPASVFGEQVEGAVRHGWLDLVRGDMEGEDYAFAAAVLGAHSVGAPHIRQRLWFTAQRLANTDRRQRDGLAELRGLERNGQDAGRAKGRGEFGACGDNGGMADSIGAGLEGRDQGEVGHERPAVERGCGVGGMGDADGKRKSTLGRLSGGEGTERTRVPSDCNPDPLDGFWRDADWLYCRDGKWRPARPGSFPLAHGVSSRVGRLRAYGNAIVPQVAAEYIRASL